MRRTKSKVIALSSYGELFINEDVRDRMLDIYPDIDGIIEVPSIYYQIHDASELPDEGSAPVVNDDEELIGTISWRVKFSVDTDGCANRYIEATPTRVRFKKAQH